MKVAILGCGYMGTALLRGLLEKGDTSHTYTAHVTSSSSAQRVERALGDASKSRVAVTFGQESVVDAVAGADVVLLGVQPKDLAALSGTAGLVGALQGSAVVSMLAGVSVAQVRQALAGGGRGGFSYTVARIIPTLGAARGDSVTLLADADAWAEPARFGRVEQLLAQVGSVVRVPERLMDSATALGAAAHALAIVAIDAATDASVAAGMPRDVAKAIAAESLRSGSGLMCGEGGMTPEQVKAAMSTPGGITLNAVVNLDAGARSAVASAVKQAISYAGRMNQ